MNSKEVSKEIEAYNKDNYNVAINLPSWNGKNEEQRIVTEAETERKRRNQIYIALGVLTALILAIVFIQVKK